MARSQPRGAGGFKMGALGGLHRDDQARDQVSALLGEVDPSLAHLASLPFRNPIALHRYAVLLREFFAELGERPPPSITAPTLAITSPGDRVADPRAAAAFAEWVPGVRRVVLADDDHYTHYFDPAVARLLGEFFAEHP